MKPDETTNTETSFDSVIDKVDFYIADPGMVTPETLEELRNELLDLQTKYEGEDSTVAESPGLQNMMEKARMR